jgi:hypothetical protein
VVSTLQQRLSTLLELPSTVLQNSGTMQIVHYNQDGQYTLHLDSGLAPQPRSSASGALPCCHLTKLKSRILKALAQEQDQSYKQEQLETSNAFEKPCRLCRYATVFYYLNTIPVDGGGATAFPLASNATLQSLQQQAILEKEKLVLQHEPGKGHSLERSHAGNLATRSIARDAFEAEVSRFRATDAAR